MKDTVGTRLKQARLSQHLSVRELKRRSGVAVGTIRRIEAGDAAPYDYTLSKLADALNVDPQTFLEVEGVAS